MLLPADPGHGAAQRAGDERSLGRGVTSESAESKNHVQAASFILALVYFLSLFSVLQKYRNEFNTNLALTEIYKYAKRYRNQVTWPRVASRAHLNRRSFAPA